MSFPNPDGQKKLDEMSTKLKEHLSDERIDLLLLNLLNGT
jgi:hypothetical protein